MGSPAWRRGAAIVAACACAAFGAGIGADAASSSQACGTIKVIKGHTMRVTVIRGHISCVVARYVIRYSQSGVPHTGRPPGPVVVRRVDQGDDHLHDGQADGARARHLLLICPATRGCLTRGRRAQGRRAPCRTQNFTFGEALRRPSAAVAVAVTT